MSVLVKAGLGAEVTIRADFSLESFEHILALLGGEQPVLVGGGAHMITREVVAVVERKYPSVAFVQLPTPILSHPDTWFVVGKTITAFQQGS